MVGNSGLMVKKRTFLKYARNYEVLYVSFVGHSFTKGTGQFSEHLNLKLISQTENDLKSYRDNLMFNFMHFRICYYKKEND